MEISEGGGAILEVWGPDEAFHLDEACMAIEDISEENPGHPELAKAIGPLDRVHLDKVRAGVVARALQNFGDARVVPLLIKIAKRREICREAYEALGELGDERAVEPMLERNENLRDGSAPARHCLIQLAKKNPENISVLRMVRKTSELLGRHDIAEYAADDLMEMLELCDTELKVDIFKGNLD
ncbi:TPA: HEAT repeat domain-containing protein, partial [Candidatus Micrarchaeota archaeon]|nr:HEAT repeat domain-containing protein [Candidatus Micrarchaeota archaeon]